MNAYDREVNDFLEGAGSGCPELEICKTLIEEHTIIREYVDKAVEEERASISVMPYGDSISFCKDPAYVGPSSTSVKLVHEKGVLIVHFDRN